MNVTTLAGNLTRDPESRAVGEASVCKFGIAVRRRFVGKDGVKADFFDCEAWRKPGEIIEKFLKKGGYCVVTGELRNDSWEDKGGAGKRFKTVLVVENVSLGPNTSGEAVPPQSHADTGVDDNSIPF